MLFIFAYYQPGPVEKDDGRLCLQLSEGALLISAG